MIGEDGEASAVRDIVDELAARDVVALQMRLDQMRGELERRRAEGFELRRRLSAALQASSDRDHTIAELNAEVARLLIALEEARTGETVEAEDVPAANLPASDAVLREEPGHDSLRDLRERFAALTGRNAESADGRD